MHVMSALGANNWHKNWLFSMLGFVIQLAYHSVPYQSVPHICQTPRTGILVCVHMHCSSDFSQGGISALQTNPEPSVVVANHGYLMW